MRFASISDQPVRYCIDSDNIITTVREVYVLNIFSFLSPSIWKNRRLLSSLAAINSLPEGWNLTAVDKRRETEERERERERDRRDRDRERGI